MSRRNEPGLVESTEAWRVVHAEGDDLSGLVVDRYADVLVIELHSAGWRPFLDTIVSHLHGLLGTKHHRIGMVERIARLEGVSPISTLSPGCPDSVQLRERDMRVRVDFTGGHKTGWFCDQRDNRRDFAARARGEVLDLCCHTGGFALAALVGGDPESLTGVDLDEKAIAQAKKNLDLNQVRARLVHADAFDWLRQTAGTERRYDAVVLDPPKFIGSRREIETGRGKYHDLNRLALRVVRPGGLLLTCSCSGLLSGEEFRGLVTTAARKEKRRTRVLARTGAGADHPVALECAEGEYLHSLWLEVDA